MNLGYSTAAQIEKSLKPKRAGHQCSETSGLRTKLSTTRKAEVEWSAWGGELADKLEKDTCAFRGKVIVEEMLDGTVSAENCRRWVMRW